MFFSLRSQVLRVLRGDLQMENCSSSVNILEIKKRKNQLLLVLFLALCASVWQVQTGFRVEDGFVLHLAAAGSVSRLDVPPPLAGRKISLPLETTEWHTSAAKLSLPGETCETL